MTYKPPNCSYRLSLSLVVLCKEEDDVLLTQTPQWVTGQPGTVAQIECNRSSTNYHSDLWYQQKAADRELKLIGMLVRGSQEPSLEAAFQDKGFKIRRDSDKRFSLQITQMTPDGTAMYFCAFQDTVL